MRSGWVIGVLTLCLTHAAEAQVNVFVAGGPSIPLRGFDRVAKLGGLGFVGATVPVSRTRVALGGEILYGRNPHHIVGDRSSLYGALGLARYVIVERRRLSVFASAGAGALLHSRASERFPGLDASAVGLAVTVGAGVSLRVAPVSPFLSVGYVRGAGSLDTSFPTELVDIRAGATVSLGP